HTHTHTLTGMLTHISDQNSTNMSPHFAILAHRHATVGALQMSWICLSLSSVLSLSLHLSLHLSLLCSLPLSISLSSSPSLCCTLFLSPYLSLSLCRALVQLSCSLLPADPLIVLCVIKAMVNT